MVRNNSAHTRPRLASAAFSNGVLFGLNSHVFVNELIMYRQRFLKINKREKNQKTSCAVELLVLYSSIPRVCGK
jgi:hypothetical protein